METSQLEIQALKIKTYLDLLHACVHLTYDMSRSTSDKVSSSQTHRAYKSIICSFSVQHEGRPGHISLARCKIVEPDVTGPKSFSTWRTSTASDKIFSQRSAKQGFNSVVIIYINYLSTEMVLLEYYCISAHRPN